MPPHQRKLYCHPRFMKEKIMYTFLLAAILAFTPLPAMAADLATKKNEIQQNSKQETIALGHHLFLLFNGTKSPFQYVWSIEMVKVEGGVPKQMPLYMEEYNLDDQTLDISEGVGFAAMEHRFDPASGELEYIARDVDANVRFSYKYKLVGDTLMLTELATQDLGQCTDPSCKDSPPTVIFNATGQDAKAGK